MKNIQAFLEFVNFYWHFIYNYLDMAISLICLTQKDVSWNFNSSCYDVFNNLKKAFISTFILTYQIPNTKMIVKTYASNYTLIIILLTMTKEKKVYSVTFHFHIYKTTKLNYNTQLMLLWITRIWNISWPPKYSSIIKQDS